MGDRLFGQNTMDNHDTHNHETHRQYLSPHKNRLHNTSSLTPRQQLPSHHHCTHVEFFNLFERQ